MGCTPGGYVVRTYIFIPIIYAMYVHTNSSVFLVGPGIKQQAACYRGLVNNCME